MTSNMGPLVVLLLAVAATSEVMAAEDLPAITARGTFRVIFAADTLPEAISLDPAAAPGLEREMIEGFAALHRLKVEFLPMPTGAEQIPALVAGKGDVIIGGFGVTEERRKAIDFTVEVFPSRHVVVTRLPHPRIETLAELRRVRVGTVKETSWATTVAAAGVPAGNVNDSFSTVPEVLAALRAEQVDAIVMAAGWALLEMRKDPRMQIGTFVGPRGGRAWGVRKDAPLLLQALDEYVTNVRRSPTWSRLVVKYYGDLALQVLKRARDEP
jgi:ABC-type amino acid transport substrate-binding protein